MKHGDGDEGIAIHTWTNSRSVHLLSNFNATAVFSTVRRKQINSEVIGVASPKPLSIRTLICYMPINLIK